MREEWEVGAPLADGEKGDTCEDGASRRASPGYDYKHTHAQTGKVGDEMPKPLSLQQWRPDGAINKSAWWLSNPATRNRKTQTQSQNPDRQGWPIRAPHWCLKCLATAGMVMGSGSTMWYDTIQYDSIRYNRYDTVRYETIRNDTIWYDAIRQQKIWYQTKWNDAIWNDAVQYLIIQYNTKWYDTIGCNTRWCKTIPYYEN